jgi:hypothetical protein
VFKEFSSQPKYSLRREKENWSAARTRIFVFDAECAVLSRAHRKNASFCDCVRQCAKVNCPIFAWVSAARHAHSTIRWRRRPRAASTPHANAIIERRKPLISCIYYSIYAHFSTPVIGPRSARAHSHFLHGPPARIYRLTWRMPNAHTHTCYVCTCSRNVYYKYKYGRVTS